MNHKGTRSKEAYMKKFKQILSINIMMIFFTIAAHANPQGEVTFDDLSSFYGEPKVEVNLSSALMNMVGVFAKNEDPEIAEILSNLESIKVRVYNLNGNIENASTMVDSLSKQLRANQWDVLVTVNEEGQKVRVFSKSTNNVIDGIVVMVVAPEEKAGEAVFINIVGEIDPNKIAKITNKLGVDL